jgi:hypothetical protein
MSANLHVISEYIDSDSYIFYITNFMKILSYLYLANNYNKYYFIITNETENDIIQINQHLLNNSKNPAFDRNNLFIVTCSENLIQCCNNNNLNIINHINIEFISHQPSIISKPFWAFDNHHLFMKYYQDENIKIIHLEGFEHNWNIIPFLKNNIYIFISFSSYSHKYLFQLYINTLFTLNNNYNKKNITFLSPDLDCILWAYEYGFSSILCNHNCFIDYNIFTITDDIKIYDAVMNCRPELWKRPFLCYKVNNLAYIKGRCYGKERYDYTKLNYKYINEIYLSCIQVVEIYNKSFCGLIFSEREGSSYSSSEYLLCGLPVISTLSRGGRDTWYNKNNSIIVEPDQDRIKEMVELCIKNINENIFNREKIRNEHIILSNQMRNIFIEYTQNIFNKHNISIDAKVYWDKMYFHKMKYNISTEQCIQELSCD